MKKLMMLGAVALFLTSCSSSDDNTTTTTTDTTILPVKVESLYEDAEEDNFTSVLTYDGNKILQMVDTDGEKSVFTYSGDYITKIVEYNDENAIDVVHEYAYESGKLKTWIASYYDSGNIEDKFKAVYTYNGDVVTKKSYRINTEDNTEVLNGTGVLTYSNENLVKEEFSGVSSSSTKIIRTFEYDSKNNPFANVKGILLLKGDFRFNKNNEIKLVEKLIYSDGKIATNTVTTTYEYNSNNFPVKGVEIDISNDGADEDVLNFVLTYNK